MINHFTDLEPIDFFVVPTIHSSLLFVPVVSPTSAAAISESPSTWSLGNARTSARRYGSCHDLHIIRVMIDDASQDADYLKKLPKETKTLPMVVLVNGGSAAASEIVAGALQDHQRATIIGARTYGRGTVQTIVPLRGTTMKLTIARIFRPNGKAINAAITPDVIAEDPPRPLGVSPAREDEQLLQAVKLLNRLSPQNPCGRSLDASMHPGNNELGLYARLSVKRLIAIPSAPMTREYRGGLPPNGCGL
jgi:hypothetical protein